MQEPRAEGSFGDYLREIREEREGLSIGGVLIRLQRFGINTDRGTISRYENDKRTRLDPVILWGLGQVYGEPADRLLGELVKRAGLKARELPESRLAEAYEAEQQVVRMFRRATKPVRQEILELLEFKARRTKGGRSPRVRKNAAVG